MATVSILLRTKRKNSRGESPLYVRVNVDQERAFKSLNIWINKSWWDAKKELVKPRQVKDDPSYQINEVLQTIKARAEKIQREHQAKNTLAEINNEPVHLLTATKLKALIFNEQTEDKKQVGYLEFAEHHIEELNEKDRYNLWKKRRSIYRKFKEFIEKEIGKGKDIPFAEIDIKLLKKHHQYLLTEKKNSVNTAAKDIGELGAIFNHAIEQEIIPLIENPFKHLKLETTKPEKIPLYSDELEKFKFTEIEDKELDQVRDYFLFQIYCHGMRVSDLCTLTPENILDGGNILRYKMLKTSQTKEIQLVQPAQNIIKKYEPFREDSFLFPILDHGPSYYKTDRLLKKEIQSKTAVYNVKLKEVAKALKIKKNLTTHISRHTFAHTALSAGWSKEEIQIALGHASISTTEKYLSEFKNLNIDKKMVELFNTDLKKVG